MRIQHIMQFMRVDGRIIATRTDLLQRTRNLPVRRSQSQTFYVRQFLGDFTRPVAGGMGEIRDEMGFVTPAYEILNGSAHDHFPFVQVVY